MAVNGVAYRSEGARGSILWEATNGGSKPPSQRTQFPYKSHHSVVLIPSWALVTVVPPAKLQLYLEMANYCSFTETLSTTHLGNLKE